MTTTFAVPEPDDNGKSDETQANLLVEDIEAHMRFLQMFCFFAGKGYIHRNAAINLIDSLKIGQMPRGRRKIDQQAREIWLYARAKHDKNKAIDGTGAPDFANDEEEETYKNWMAFDVRREFVKPTSNQEVDDGPTI